MYMTIEQFVEKANVALPFEDGKGNHVGIEFEGVMVKVRKTRVYTLIKKKGERKCACCGAVAKYVKVDKLQIHGVAQTKITVIGEKQNGVEVVMTADHIIARTRGGSNNVMENMQLQCMDCNRAKGNMLPSEEIMGRLWWKRTTFLVNGKEISG